jgi:hypothetical protein
MNEIERRCEKMRSASKPIRDVLVMATNRVQMAAQCLRMWADIGFDEWDGIVLVQDRQDRIEIDECEIVASWEDVTSSPIRQLISKQDAAIKAYGVYLALLMGAERIHVLDDDCYPATNAPAAHRGVLTLGCMVDQWQSPTPKFYTRGFPYKPVVHPTKADVSMGLWSGVADLDAMTTLTRVRDRQGISISDTELTGNWIVPSHVFVPMSGMNLAFTRRMAPLMYFAPSGYGYPYARFDDIWMGVVAQRGMRALGWLMAVNGSATVRHNRASNAWTNLVKESSGARFHETFWQIVNGATVNAVTARGAAIQIADQLRGEFAMKLADEIGDDSARQYLSSYAQRLCDWAQVVGELCA